MNRYLFSLAGDYTDIARDEVATLFSGTINKIDDVRIILETKEGVLQKAKRLGLTKFICKIKEEILVSNWGKQHIQLENTYKIDVVKLSATAPPVRKLADELYCTQEDPEVDLHNPIHHYIFFWGEIKIYCTELLWENKDDAHSRRSHLKAHNHPTSTHPRLAKAMINLGGAPEFIDPFCGAGGIVMEGRLTGLKVKGSDIDRIQVKRAQANAKALGLDISFEQKNALDFDEKTPVVVSDLPFGKNSSLQGKVEELYTRFLRQAARYAYKLVLGIEGSIDIDKLISNSGWTIMKSYDIYVHKSMTRKIVVLELNPNPQ